MNYSMRDKRGRFTRRPRDWPPGAYFLAGSAWALFCFWWLMQFAESL